MTSVQSFLNESKVHCPFIKVATLIYFLGSVCTNFTFFPPDINFSTKNGHKNFEIFRNFNGQNDSSGKYISFTRAVEIFENFEKKIHSDNDLTLKTVFTNFLNIWLLLIYTG